LKLSAPVHNAGVTQQFNSSRTIWPALVHNVEYYGRDLEYQVGIVFTAWLLLSFAAFLVVPSLRHRRENHLYLACILALVPLLLPAANRDVRYLFFGIPALMVLGFESMTLVFKRLLRAHWAPALTVLVATGLSLSQINDVLHRPFRGTDHTPLAGVLKDRPSRRLLYCGENVWYFVVAMRFVNPDSRTIIIRCDKVDPSIFTPGSFEHFARRYAIDTVVFEPSTRPHPWDFLLVHPTQSMQRDRVVPASTNHWRKVVIYDFKNSGSEPDSKIDVPISFTNGSMSLDL
jgi:hypothetical protein